MRKKIILLLLAAVLILSAVPAFAGSTDVTAKIPVSCIGIEGSFALFDNDEVIDSIHLKGGESGTLQVELTTFDYFTYTVSQIEMNDPDVDYDCSVYTVKVMTLLDDEDNPTFSVTVYDSEGNEKKDELIFRNYLPDVPQTGDDSDMLLWGGLLAASTAGIVLMILLLKRKEHKHDGK